MENCSLPISHFHLWRELQSRFQAPLVSHVFMDICILSPGAFFLRSLYPGLGPQPSELPQSKPPYGERAGTFKTFFSTNLVLSTFPLLAFLPLDPHQPPRSIKLRTLSFRAPLTLRGPPHLCRSIWPWCMVLSETSQYERLYYSC